MVINQEAVFHLKAKYIKLVVTSLSVVLFMSVYSICNVIYPENDPLSISGWWHLKTDLYLFLVTAWIGIASMPKHTDKVVFKIQRVITAIGVGYGMANFIDRRFLHDREFGFNDLGIVLVIVLVSLIDLKKIKHKAIKQFKNN